MPALPSAATARISSGCGRTNTKKWGRRDWEISLFGALLKKNAGTCLCGSRVPVREIFKYPTNAHAGFSLTAGGRYGIDGGGRGVAQRLARAVRDREVGSSNLPAPTIMFAA